MLGLVAAQNASSLDLGSGAPRQLLVEVDNALHGDAIGVGADSLDVALYQLRLFPVPPRKTPFMHSPGRSPFLVLALDSPLPPILRPFGNESTALHIP